MSLETQSTKATTSRVGEENQNVIDHCQRRNVVLTGFGLFCDHQINPSWEVIKEEQLDIKRPDVNIIAKQLNVSYEEVDRVVNDLWNEYNPLVMIHCGLAANENSIRLEQVARHGPYIHDDVRNHAPHKDLREYDNQPQDVDNCLDEEVNEPEYTCKPCSFESSSTCLNVERICQKLNQFHKEGRVPLSYKRSVDAGLYVCEYTFQKSLRICDRAIFIHMPGTANFKMEDIRMAVKLAVEAVIDEALALTSK